jgi:hypothetical protein
MHRFYAMTWRVYTKRLVSTNGIFTRWYWCAELPHGSLESPEGFSSRAQCEANAIRSGCRAADQQSDERLFKSHLSPAWTA